jgi:uncharacterized protein (DUF1330 family)
MPAYIIAEITVHDPQTYDRYRAQTPAAVERYGGRFVVRGGDPEALEGGSRPERVVVLEFPDRAQAKRFYDSPEYRAILPLRLAASEGSLLLVDGV